jgi:hypothetical protein
MMNTLVDVYDNMVTSWTYLTDLINKHAAVELIVCF